MTFNSRKPFFFCPAPIPIRDDRNVCGKTHIPNSTREDEKTQTNILYDIISSMVGKEGAYRFHPESMLGKVNRERAVALAGGLALHLQIARLPIAQALVDSGKIKRDAYKRLRETAQFGIDITFDTIEGTQAVADKITAMHRKVRGTLDETVGAHHKGDSYSAFSQEDMKWVAATTAYSSLVGYDTFVHPLTEAQKDNYLQQTKPLFELLHFKADMLPNSYKELQHYIQEEIASGRVKVGTAAKELAPYVILSHTPMRKALMYGMYMSTAFLLPKALQDQFGYHLPAWQKKLVSQTAHGLQRVIMHIPPEGRFWPQYRDAKKRIRES